jgi:hypothetical protein
MKTMRATMWELAAAAAAAEEEEKEEEEGEEEEARERLTCGGSPAPL